MEDSGITHIAEDSSIVSVNEDSGIASFSEDSGNIKLAFIVWEDSIVYCGGFARTDNLHDLMFWRIRSSLLLFLALAPSTCAGQK